tara:strand:- start:16 stop:204 length:189 start_codon:yes stop_codon:yes gene_type:complete
MYLDETILQSRTTITLVDFIKKLWFARNAPVKLQKEYKEIIRLSNKAEKKRTKARRIYANTK